MIIIKHIKHVNFNIFNIYNNIDNIRYKKRFLFKFFFNGCTPTLLRLMHKTAEILYASYNTYVNGYKKKKLMYNRKGNILIKKT